MHLRSNPCTISVFSVKVLSLGGISLLSLVSTLLVGCSSAISSKQLEPSAAAIDDKDEKKLRKLADGYAYSLPSGRVKVTAVKKPDETPTISVETFLVGDPKYPLIASTRASGLADDEVTFEKEAGTGLLKSVTGSYKDKTAEIVESIVETGVKAFKITHGIIPGLQDRTFRVDDTSKGDYYSFVVEFDPFDDRSIKRAEALFKTKKLRLDFFGRLGNRFTGYTTIPKDNRRLYYRSLLPYQVQVTDEKNFAYTAVNVLLPDESPILSVDLKRAFLVDKVNELTFDHGVLTKVHTVKPSEILALFKSLGNIVDKVASLSPIQIKVDQSKARTALINQQNAEIKALGSKYDDLVNTANSQAALKAKEKELQRQADADKRTADRNRNFAEDRNRRLIDSESVLEDKGRALGESLQRETTLRNELEKAKQDLDTYKKEHQ